MILMELLPEKAQARGQQLISNTMSRKNAQKTLKCMMD
jgi:hypothetical protein